MADGVWLVRDADEMERLLELLRKTARLAIDVEANGLFAFRPSLCTVQIAWEIETETRVAIVDALAVPVAPLAPILAASGPIKVLHDLTFDAKLLDECGAPLARVRDTSVAARMLGVAATGLSSMLESELGVHIDKKFQQHDWKRRPLRPEQIAYLAEDVRHLLALDDRLAARTAERDLVDEVEVECAYKLATALRPPKDVRPAYVRVKGADKLDAPGRAVLRRLVLARQRIAERVDVPPFKVVSNEVLVDLARARPADREHLVAASPGVGKGRAGDYLAVFQEAIEEGVREGDVPPEDRVHFEPRTFDRELRQRRKAFESELSAWRKAEAARRNVDEQAVLPGHCAQDVVDLLLEARPVEELRALLAGIPGLGAQRLARYGDAFVAVASATPKTP